MKFKTKVVGTYVMGLLALFFLSFFSILRAEKSLDEMNFIRNTILVSMENMNQIKVDVIQIQQWLTDASATGYVDGINTAEEYFIHALIYKNQL